MRALYLLLFLPLLCFGQANYGLLAVQQAPAAGGGACAVLYAAASRDNVQSVGANTTFQFGGQTWNTNAPVTVCSVSFYLELAAGDVSGKTYTVRLYTMSGEDLGSVVASTAGVTGNNAWASTKVTFTFASHPTLSANTDYAFVIDAGVADASNYIHFFYHTGDVMPGKVHRWFSTGANADSTPTNDAAMEVQTE